jgi:hypothetical protein
MSMVGVTGLEPATSRPPAVRATNCATPRNKVPGTGFDHLRDPRWVSALGSHGYQEC